MSRRAGICQNGAVIGLRTGGAGRWRPRATDVPLRVPGDVVVVGATGMLGGEICRRLRARGEHVRGLVRSTSDPSARAGLEDAGVHCHVGDIEQPASLDACFEGASVVVTPASSFPHDPRPDAIERVDRAGQLAVVDAAERAGVERVVYVSFPPATLDHPFQRAKRAVEARLRCATLEHVILQPEKFMDVWFSVLLGFEPERRVTLYGGGLAPQAWIAVGDVAEVAVQAVRSAAAGNQTIPFGGPERLTQREVVAIYERTLGHAIATEVMEASAIEAMMADAPTPTVESLGGVLLEATEPSGVEWPAFADTFDMRRTSVAEFAAVTPER